MISLSTYITETKNNTKSLSKGELIAVIEDNLENKNLF